MKLEFSRQIFEKSPNIKFHENPSSGSRVVPCGRTDRQKNKKIIVAFRNFAKAPKKNTVTLERVEALLFKQAVQPHYRAALCTQKTIQGNGLALVWLVLD
jgi:hypothetical protein